MFKCISVLYVKRFELPQSLKDATHIALPFATLKQTKTALLIDPLLVVSTPAGVQKLLSCSTEPYEPNVIV